jgi:uncharacterized protein YidB (DUF937 family)
MGLLDSILGNMMGAGGTSMQGRGGSTSPIVQALMALLATKALQHNRSGSQDGSLGGGLGGMLGGQGGGLGGMLGGGGGLGGGMPGGLGGLLGGSGSSAGGGLGGLLDQFRQNGYGDHADSWVGTGQNRRLAPDELSHALGPDTIDELEQQTGMPRQQLLAELSDHLPDAVDHFTPDGRLPTHEEVSSRWADR